MAKKQQMRWSDEGAHCLAQVRVADINGEFPPCQYDLHHLSARDL